MDIRFTYSFVPNRYSDLVQRMAVLTPLLGPAPPERVVDKVNAEDRAVVEGIYRGSLSPLAKSGPLSWLERNVYDFMCYLSRQLAHPGQVRHTPAGEQSAVVDVQGR